MTKKQPGVPDMEEKIDLDFMSKTPVLIRLYMIDAFEIPPKDDDSDSDPFLKIRLGKTLIDDKKNYQLDTNNPKFNRLFEIKTTLPGPSELEIEVWDWDQIGADDFIGRTKIDLENRFFSRKYRKLKDVPIETHSLYHPASSLKQGSVRFWVEIIPQGDNDALDRIWNITPRPPADFELRAIIWEARDVPIMDVEGTTDIYVTGTISDGTTLKTDVHLRSQNGKGSFNWRMVFPVKLPMKSNTISFKIWDKDLIAKDDFISEISLDISKEAETAYNHEIAIPFHDPKKKNEEKFWLKCKGTDEKGQLTDRGEILVSMELIPKSAADLSKVGQGRSEPNQNPFLPPPIGRLKLSLNPLNMWEQLIGPVARRQVYCVLYLICCGVFLYLMGPQIMVALFFKVTGKIFG
eukprot:TRINITY_DN7982_c0_g1_i1.p1 TRINITY_DN7982_c0_g1~~TRINITY_DN7982_c0_g1_i1.p1  ORF type:complete len:406 (+),score=138.25 TRINITY_DN7982_c0_g1_i1:307-1524(+)